MTRDEMLALAERLSKRAEQEKAIAENSRVVADLLEPQMGKFEKRDGSDPWNTYAVRMHIDHRNSAKRDAAFAEDLYAAVNFISARAAQLGQEGEG